MVQHVGGLFAAKEAVLKALGTGGGRAPGSATSRSCASRASAPPSVSTTARCGVRGSSASSASTSRSRTSVATRPPSRCSKVEERYHSLPVSTPLQLKARLGVVSLAVLVVDQWTKHLAESALAGRPPAHRDPRLHRSRPRREHRCRLRSLRRRLQHARRSGADPARDGGAGLVSITSCGRQTPTRVSCSRSRSSSAARSATWSTAS